MQQWLTPALVSALATFVTTALAAVTGTSHRARSRLRAATRLADAWEEWAYSVRHAARVYNATIPTQAPPFITPPFPEVAADDDPAP